MNYKMQVTIANPETPKGMISDLVLKIEAYYSVDENDYGNGHYLHLIMSEERDQWIDLRYNKRFNRNKKMQFLVDWAFDYWNGENGAYYVKSITVSEAE